jgi:hypothetical protein
MSSDVVLFVGGVVTLTLAEYVVHRFVLHGFAPIEHRLHHANPDDPVLTIFWQIWICFALVYLISGGAFVAGVLVAYAWLFAIAKDHTKQTIPSTRLRFLCPDSLVDGTKQKNSCYDSSAHAGENLFRRHHFASSRAVFALQFTARGRPKGEAAFGHKLQIRVSL